MQLPFFTIGHSTRTIDDFAALLEPAGVTLVADIRKVPRSRTNPQYNADVLAGNLALWGISYVRIEALGGLRGHSRTIPPERNGFWRNTSFHNYADYALSEAFGSGLAQLLAMGREQRTAIMCAEAVWWRCHRRIVADYLLARGERVFHLIEAGKLHTASLTPGAMVNVTSGQVTYPDASKAVSNLKEPDTGFKARVRKPTTRTAGES